MTWNILWSRPAERDMRRLDPGVSQRIQDAVEQLAETGHGDVRPLQGRERQWRLRVGELRVLFTYDSATATIQIIRVLPRGRVYR
ncbi:MAG: type II toxin-antitoxin system RelE/ParE family toxin [Chloroflexia bacterium]|nr:type II toxin-antitoxin system RelE/ParE family toxin [Chloroflexia bacterium]